MLNSFVKPFVRLVEERGRRLGYRLTWAPPACANDPGAELRFEFEFVVAHLMLERRSIFFLQIGANDGVSNDPLHKFVTKFGWEGILLEPLPAAFEMLRRNYAGNPNLKLINAALSHEDGHRTLYTLRMDADTFPKAHQFSSFSLERLLGQNAWVPEVASKVERVQVECISLKTLLREANGRAIDILQIDAEGYDLQILRMIDFSAMRPAIISYEHSGMSKAEQEEAVTLLIGQGYRLTRGNSDTVAYCQRHNYGFR